MISSTVLNRFLKLVKIDTESNEESLSFPSTEKQLVFLNMIKEELLALGLETTMDEHGYVFATLKSNLDYKTPTICFIAHVDTAPGVSGKNVNPKVVMVGDADIEINKDLNIYLRCNEDKYLASLVGEEIVITDGTTLLGADDKAGVSEIMTAIEFLVKNPSLKHGNIKIAFTPDEEVGRGVDYFDVEKLGADFGYTIDGGELGEIEYENFNACGVDVKITGFNMHPGYAKDKMVNAIDVFTEFNATIPNDQKPQTTSGYQGFFMPTDVQCSVEECTAKYIIRDFEINAFEAKKQFMKDLANTLQAKYKNSKIEIQIKDQYSNMKSQIEKHFHLIDNAKRAMAENDIDFKVVPIRGGTDGCRLSFMGLPCPNLSTGGINFHSRTEYIPVKSLEKMTKVILKLIDIYAKGKK